MNSTFSRIFYRFCSTVCVVSDQELHPILSYSLFPIEISEWFGTIESTFYDHPKAPHRDIFRVSNDRTEGCTNVGRTGWHIDGSFQEKPFSHSIYHIIECPKEGDTVFASLTEIIERLDKKKREYWEMLYMASDRRGMYTYI